MLQFIHYYGKYQDLRGSFGGLPGWAKWPILIAAVPGVILALLSLLALVVSIIALLLLTVPTYRLMQLVVGGSRSPGESKVSAAGDDIGESIIDAEVVERTGPRRQIDVRIVE